MKPTFLIIFLVLLFKQNHSQKITYSDFQKGNFDLFRFQVIAKYNEEVLVYTGFSEISYFSADMKLKKKIELPFGYYISGVHFLAYNDFFYMFYQYASKRTVFCMAAKFSMEGNLIGDPIELDRTPRVSDIFHQTQIYTVIPSENKAHFIALKMDYGLDSGYILTVVSLDENLRQVHRFSGALSKDFSLHFSEYCVDNEGNLFFTGQSSGSWKNDNKADAFLFRLGWCKNAVNSQSLLPRGIYTDQVRLFLDNTGQKCLIAFYYSNSWGGGIKGINLLCLNTSSDTMLWVNHSINSDGINPPDRKKATAALNNYYIQQIRFRRDGGFLIETEELADYATSYAERWNRLDLMPDRVAEDFAFYDAYEIDRYYPWDAWRHRGLRYLIASGNAIFMSFSPKGLLEWENKININQREKFHAILGYKSFVTQDQVNLVFNQTIGNRVFLMAQSINASGKINPDGLHKEDMGLKDTYSDYNYFPRFAKQLSANELIITCRKGGEPILAKIEF